MNYRQALSEYWVFLRNPEIFSFLIDSTLSNRDHITKPTFVSIVDSEKVTQLVDTYRKNSSLISSDCLRTESILYYLVYHSLNS